VDPSVAIGLAGGVGVLTGVAAMLAFRVSEAAQSGPPEEAAAPLVPAPAESVLAVLGSSTVLVDRDDAVVRASPAAYAFGLVRDGGLVHDELRELVRRVRRDGEIRDTELELPRGPLGEEKLAVSARVAPLGTSLVLLLVEDRTESRRVDAVRRDFIANVSHELKTPVGALSLLAEAVLGASDDPEAVRRFAGRMQGEVTRLTDLVQELIDLSRLQYDDPLREAEHVALGSVARAAVDHTHLLAEAKDIAVTLDAGDPAGPVEVLGDRDQLVTAVRNLVENAIAYSPDHTRIAVGVRRTVGAEGAALAEITVTDQGIGISPVEQQRIFERFYRVDPARSRATGGTGLGLSIVKHIAMNHGGEVTAWSAEGAGSTFTIRLPVAADVPTPAGEPSPARTPSAVRKALP
jgi:two-component system sensor histidine kinase SenX3